MLLAGILGIAFWLLVLLTGARLAKRIPALPPVSGASVHGRDLVSVIVPAKNEEKDVERAMRSLLDQTHSNLISRGGMDHRPGHGGGVLLSHLPRHHPLEGQEVQLAP